MTVDEEESDLVSIIVPTWNEEHALARCLESILANAPPFEVFVSDAGSRDGTATVAKRFENVHVLRSPRRGRAAQMNHAAGEARGRILRFVHADSVVSATATRRIRATFEDPGVVGGSFRFAVDSPRRAFRILEAGVRARTRWLRAPYGDQGLFMRATAFDRIGGFPDVPLLEDLRLVRLLRKRGKLAALDDPLLTSARRWEESGFLATTSRHLGVMVLERLGVSTARLARLREGRTQTRRLPPGP